MAAYHAIKKKTVLHDSNYRDYPMKSKAGKSNLLPGENGNQKIKRN
jgi:hypothetical protein